MRGLFAAPLMLCLGLTVPAAAQDATPATPQSSAPECIAGICQIKLTPQQLLARAETLVRERRFAEAEPLIAALEQAPEMKLQSRFLAGYAASEQGDYKRASNVFKAILTDDPKQTRVRLELARAMLGLGQTASADRQFRIAQQDGDLPPNLARIIRGARDVIRSQRAWRLDVDFGIAPDSNINGATSVDTVNVQLGDVTLPVSLNEDAQARSGTGQVASLSGGVRLPMSPTTAMLVDFYGNANNYSGVTYDDFMVQLAAGPELRLSQKASISGQLVGAQRWYGGKSVSHQLGGKIGGQVSLSDRARAGVQLDARHTTALFDSNYSGWQLGLYGNVERALSKTMVGSAGLFVRRDALRSPTYSNTELGASLGVAGELPLGISYGLNGTLSRALYDAPMGIFSNDPRRDWRLGTSLTVGNRKIRVLGFSPTVQLSYARTDSTLPFFANDRLRLRMAVARYF